MRYPAELHEPSLGGTSSIITPEGAHPATIEGLEKPVPPSAPQTHVEHSFRKEHGGGRTWRPNPNSVGDRPTEPPSRSQSRRSAKAPLPDLDAAVYVTNAQVRQLLPVCNMTIWRWINDPIVSFPKPVQLGNAGRDFWWLPAIRAWMCRREEQQRRVPIKRGVSPAIEAGSS
jgi:predicted DNA-binding transcriptional regulator AlpA